MSKVFDQICEEGRQEIIDQLIASGMSQEEIDMRLASCIRPAPKYSGASGDPEAKSLDGIIKLDDLAAPNKYVVPPSDDDIAYVTHFRNICKRYNINFTKADEDERDFVMRMTEKSFQQKKSVREKADFRYESQLLTSGMSLQEINERLSGPSDDPEERITAAKSLFGCIPYDKLQENRIPLIMNLNALPENKGLKAMKAASVMAEKNGLSDMTLEEINMEISEVRKKEP